MFNPSSTLILNIYSLCKFQNFIDFNLLFHSPTQFSISSYIRITLFVKGSQDMITFKNSLLWVFCCCLVAKSHPGLCDAMDCSLPGSPSVGFHSQEYCSGLSFPPPGDLPDPGITPTSLVPPALAGRFFITTPPGKPILCFNIIQILKIRYKSNLFIL